MKRCKSCGSELADHVKFCTECGEKYDSSEDLATSQPYEDITKHEDITKYNDITRHEEVQLEREMARSMENIETDIFPPHRKEPLEEASRSSSSYQGGEIPPTGNIFPEQTFASAAKEEASAAQGFEQRAWRQDMNTGERGANEEASAYHYGYGAGSPKKRGNKTTFVIIIGIIALLCLGGVVYAGLQILSSSRHMITESKDKNKDRKKDKDKKDKGDKKDKEDKKEKQTEEAEPSGDYESLISEIRTPSYWYGSINFKAINHEEEDYQIDVFGTVDKTEDGMHFIELYEYDSIQGEEEPFPVFSLPIEENSLEIIPIIGEEDAWILDTFFTEENEEDLQVKLENGALDFNFLYSFEEEGELYEYDCRIFLRDNEDIWDEENDPLPGNFYTE